MEPRWCHVSGVPAATLTLREFANPRREGKTRGSEEFARHELNVGTRPEAGRRTRSEHLTNSAFESPWRARGDARSGVLGGPGPSEEHSLARGPRVQSSLLRKGN